MFGQSVFSSYLCNVKQNDTTHFENMGVKYLAVDKLKNHLCELPEENYPQG